MLPLNYMNTNIWCMVTLRSTSNPVPLAWMHPSWIMLLTVFWQGYPVDIMYCFNQLKYIFTSLLFPTYRIQWEWCAIHVYGLTILYTARGLHYCMPSTYFGYLKHWSIHLYEIKTSNIHRKWTSANLFGNINYQFIVIFLYTGPCDEFMMNICVYVFKPLKRVDNGNGGSLKDWSFPSGIRKQDAGVLYQ